MAHWVASLHFLARLAHESEDGKNTIRLTAPDNRIIDSFFSHLTQGKRPSIAHMMLAHLADGLGIDTILTTNFDTLIEDAFARLDIPLVAFDVHQKAGLPSPDLVRSQRSIIKLHGGRYGLRADFTLDQSPSDSDKKAFVQYFGPIGSPEAHHARKHLLVLGCSGDDQRTCELIRHALRSITDMQVYWLCYRPEQKQQEGNGSIRSRFAEFENRVHVQAHPDIGLFLLELYQHLWHSLPPGNVEFPAFWPAPPNPYDVVGTGEEPEFRTEVNWLQTSLLTRLPGDEAPANTRRKDPTLPRHLLLHGKPGVSSVAARVAQDLYADYECFWLDLDMFWSWHHCFVTLIDTVARRFGMSAQTRPVSASDGDSAARYFRDFSKSRSCVVFLNGREPAGVNAGWGLAQDSNIPPWNAQDWQRLTQFLNSESIPSRTVFVLLVRDKECLKNATSCFEQHTITNPCIPFELHAIIESVTRLLRDSPNADTARRFVYGLTLFRRARHLAAMSSWALQKAPARGLVSDKVGEPDNDTRRADFRDEWLSKLLATGAIRYDPGGFVWMHTDIREQLRSRLEEKWRLDGVRAECHQGIADWYVKLFRSSNDPMAAFESLYHRLCCAKWATEEDHGCGDKPHLQRVALVEASVTLRLAQQRILACGYLDGPPSPLEDFQKAVENLETFLDVAAHPAQQALRDQCLELRRQVSAEVADYGGALRAVEDTHDSSTVDRKRTAVGGIRNAWCLYRKAQCLTRMRRYSEAEGTLSALKKELGFHLPMTEQSCIRPACREWLKTLDPRDLQDKLRLLIKALEEHMFLEMLSAQIDWHLRDARASDGQQSANIRNRYKHTECFWIMATELMRSVEDCEFLQTENAYNRTLCGVLLGNMGRYSEAHRRLNEAAGYLAHSSNRVDPMSWALIDLRRAEVLMTEASATTSSPSRAGQEDKYQPNGRVMRLLDGAFAALSRAERRFVGHRRNIWWWTWLYELRMLLCARLTEARSAQGLPHPVPHTAQPFQGELLS